VNPNNANAERNMQDAQDAARAKGVQLQLLRAGTEGAIDGAFATAVQLLFESVKAPANDAGVTASDADVIAMVNSIEVAAVDFHIANSENENRPYSGSVGASEVQVPATPSATNSALDRSRCAVFTSPTTM
jgi:hypothetical protein